MDHPATSLHHLFRVCGTEVPKLIVIVSEVTVWFPSTDGSEEGKEQRADKIKNGLYTNICDFCGRIRGRISYYQLKSRKREAGKKCKEEI